MCSCLFFFWMCGSKKKPPFLLLIGAKRFLSVTRPGIFYFYFYFLSPHKRKGYTFELVILTS
jgi:hypothetical protein